MNKIRLSAPTTEQAMQCALEQLRIPKEALQYQIDRSEEEYLLDDRRPRDTTIVAWISPEFLADQARDALQRMVHLMGFPCEVRSEVGEERITIRMGSPNSSVLIGKNGATLEAIQYLVTRMIGKGGRVLPPIIVDVENYKERKITRLERIAKHMAQKALADHKEIVLQPMGAADRKIIHTALKDFRGVKTFSRGAEGDRCVVIAPEEETI